MLTPLAGQVAVAIENARLYDELVRTGDAAQPRAVDRAGRPARAASPRTTRRGRAGRRRRTSGPRASWAATSTTSTTSASSVLGLAVGDVAGKGVPAALYARLRLRHRARPRVRARTRRPTCSTGSTARCAGAASRASSARWPSPSSTSRPARAARQLGAALPAPLPGARPAAAGRSRWPGCRWAPSTTPPTTSECVELRAGDVFVFPPTA